MRGVLARSTLLRSLLLVVIVGVVLLVISTYISAYQDLQLATGAYFFAALAGLTVLAGCSGQISLGQGALMAVGAYTVALLIGNEGWALIPALAASAVGHRGGRIAGRRRRKPAARSVPRGRDARVRGRPSGARRQVPRDVRRRERADHQPADPARITRVQLPARALGSVDRVRRRADRDVRALQPDAQWLRALDGGRARRRDRGLAVRSARRSYADGRVHHQRRVRRARRRAAVRRAPARRSRARSRCSCPCRF